MLNRDQGSKTLKDFSAGTGAWMARQARQTWLIMAQETFGVWQPGMKIEISTVSGRMP